MDFERFKKELREGIITVAKEWTGGGFINEGTFQTEEGKDLIFYPEDGLAGIPVNTMDHYAAFQAGWEMEAVAEAAFTTLKEGHQEQQLLERMAVPENIVPVLVSREVNRELLEKIPHIAFQGMEIIFKFILLEPVDGRHVSCSVPRSYMEECGWDEEKLFRIAMCNDAFKAQIHVMPFKKMTDALLLGDDADGLGSDWDGIREDPMKIVLLTNSLRTYGAAGVLDSDTLERISSIYGEDLYLLLPSIHECLAVPKGTMPLDHLREMVTLTAEMAELKANPNRAASGTVIEARLDKGRVEAALKQRRLIHGCIAALFAAIVVCSAVFWYVQYEKSTELDGDLAVVKGPVVSVSLDKAETFIEDDSAPASEHWYVE